MRGYQKLIVAGNATRDAEISTAQNGNPFGKFGIAVNREWFNKSTGQKQSKTEFFNIVVWGNQAKVCQYIRKGSGVLVEGEIETSEYRTADGANKQYSSVNARNIILLGGEPRNMDRGEMPNGVRSYNAGSFRAETPESFDEYTNRPYPASFDAVQLEDNYGDVDFDSLPGDIKF